MDAALTENWNKKVGPEDDVYILGDFCLKNRQAAHAYLENLTGRKHLIRGNHDYFASHPEMFTDVLTEIQPYLQVKGESGRKFILSHYPMMFWNGSVEEEVIHLYGHIHNSEYCNSWTALLKNALNVGVDVCGYVPLSEAEVLERVKEHNTALTKGSINGRRQLWPQL